MEPGLQIRMALGLVLFLSAFESGKIAADPTGPGRPMTIDIWYGPMQRFGHLGHTQRWVNILGHVSPGEEIDSLTYTLNGGDHRPLSFREDFKRLARDGDFNIEIARDKLQPGENRVVLYATPRTGQSTTAQIGILYTDDGRRWPLPYTVDWDQVKRIEDAVQVVDGKWELTPQGIRSVERYYDRVLAFGDEPWR